MTARRADYLARALGVLLGVAALAIAGSCTHTAAPSPDTGDVWHLWRAGWIPVAILFGVYTGGRAALAQERYVARRWPRAAAYLDRGKVWVVLSAAISVAAGLMPLAITGDLTQAALLGELAGAWGIYMHSTGKAARAGAAS